MNAEYVKKLDFDSDTFEDMKRDLNVILQKLLANMTDTDTTEGSIALKIDVSLIQEFIPNYDPAVDGETRKVRKPQFRHKVTSAIKINDEKSGNMNSEMELVWDEESQMYVMQPVANTEQRTIFDVEFTECYNADDEDGPADEAPALAAMEIPMLPGPEEERDDYEDYEDYDYEEPEDGAPDGSEGVTDDIL